MGYIVRCRFTTRDHNDIIVRESTLFAAHISYEVLKSRFSWGDIRATVTIERDDGGEVLH